MSKAKRIFCLAMGAMLMFCVTACKAGKEKEYNEVKMRTPFWTMDRMYNEPVIMLQAKDATEKNGFLAFVATGNVKITNYDMSITYKDGEDYTLSGYTIVRTKDSAMPFLNEEVLYGINMPDGEGLTTQDASAAGKAKGYNNVMYTESIFLIKHQVLVSYDYDKSKYDGYKPTSITAKLTNTMKILKNKEALNFVIYGDSISVGCNSTGGGINTVYTDQGSSYTPYDIAPYTPTWAEMITNAMKAKHGGDIDLWGAGRGGQTSDWGAQNAKTRPYNPDYGYDPDLVLISFGINDATFSFTKEHFKNNVRKMIEDIREMSGKTVEFILMGQMRCNPDAVQIGNALSYFDALIELSEEFDGVGAVDVAPTHDFMLRNKRFSDMMVNNINHPNDFLIRMYAQNTIAALEL